MRVRPSYREKQHVRGVSRRCPVLDSELYSIPLEKDRYLMYAPLRRAAFVANSAVVGFLAALRRGRWDHRAAPDGSLVAFLRTLEIADGGPEPHPAEHIAGAPSPNTVTLLLTTACNLRCSYCYASAGDRPIQRMSLEDARRAINFITANAMARGTGCISVNYHGGGEPTAHRACCYPHFSLAGLA